MSTMKSGSFLIPASLIILTVTTLIVVGCSKNSSGKPKLSLTSITTTVQLNDSLVATFKFSGGSVSGGYFYSIRTRLNQQPQLDSTIDTISNPIPIYSATSGEYRYALAQNTSAVSSGSPGPPDTLKWQFYTLTADSVSSDTVTSPVVIVINQ
jgi:hypothetical protein